MIWLINYIFCKNDNKNNLIIIVNNNKNYSKSWTVI